MIILQNQLLKVSLRHKFQFEFLFKFCHFHRLEMTHSADVFLSHNWGNDELNRNNHYRVLLINEGLKKLGYQTWFDEERMTGNISEQISRGIEGSKGMIAFITRQYHDKVKSENSKDNCKLEFSYAANKLSNSKMVAVVMEERMLCTDKWDGLVGLHLCGKMFVDMTGDVENEAYLRKRMKDLQKELKAMGIQPMNTTERENTNRSLHTGTFFILFVITLTGLNYFFKSIQQSENTTNISSFGLDC